MERLGLLLSSFGIGVVMTGDCGQATVVVGVGVSAWWTVTGPSE